MSIVIIALAVIALAVLVLVMVFLIRQLSKISTSGVHASNEIVEAATRIDEIATELERDNIQRTREIQSELNTILRGRRR